MTKTMTLSKSCTHVTC